MKRKLAIFLAGIMILSASGCGSKNKTEINYNKSIITTDFVTYDVTRQLTKGSDLSVELIDIEKELTGRDKNKIIKSLLFINVSDNILLEDIGDSVNMIKITDFIEQKENDSQNNMIYNDSFQLNFGDDDQSKGEQNANSQIVINDNNSNKNNQNENEQNNQNQSDDENKSNANDNNSNDNNNTNNGSNNNNGNNNNNNNSNNSNNNNGNGPNNNQGNNSTENEWHDPRLVFDYVDTTYPSAPASANLSGYTIASMPVGYEIKYTDDDSYDNWVLNRIEQLGTPLWAALDDGKGGYKLFKSEGVLMMRYKVISSIDDISLLILQDTHLLCESSIKGRIKGSNDSSMAEKKIFLAVTRDISKTYWLDVKNTMLLEEKILEKLIEIQPEDKELFEKNYEEYRSSLISLNDKLQYTVDQSVNKTIFIGGAFKYKYLTDGYQINYISIYDYSNQDETPSLTRLNNYAKVINRYNIKYIVKDNISSMDGINSIRTEVSHNVNVVIIDTMESVEDLENNTYIDIMENNIIILKKALY